MNRWYPVCFNVFSWTGHCKTRNHPETGLAIDSSPAATTSNDQAVVAARVFGFHFLLLPKEVVWCSMVLVVEGEARNMWAPVHQWDCTCMGSDVCDGGCPYGHGAEVRGLDSSVGGGLMQHATHSLGPPLVWFPQCVASLMQAVEYDTYKLDKFDLNY